MNLYQRGGIWWADYTGPNGRRVRRSTRCTDKTAAAAALVAWQRDAEWARMGLMPPDPAHSGSTFAQHIDAWCAALAMKGRDEAYIDKARKFVRSLAERFGWSALEDVRATQLEQWQAERVDEVAPHTVNNEIGYIHAFFGWCQKKKRMVENLCTIERVPDKEPAGRRRALTGEELQKLLSFTGIPDDRRTAYLALVLTGLRRSELAAVRWSMLVGLDTDACAVLLPASVTKSGRDERVFVPPPLRAALRQGSQKPGGPVFSVPTAKRFAKDCTMVGIERRDARNRVVTLHSLRHTANSMLAAAGVSSPVRQQIMRQRDVRLTDGVYLDEALLPVAAASRMLGEMVSP